MREHQHLAGGEVRRDLLLEQIRLHEIGHETLVMTGENDIGSNTRMARLMHEKIERSRLVILPRLKHSVLVEAPDMIADEVIRFLG